MENFTLWNSWGDAHRTMITFFAMSAGFQRISKGTPEMVREMFDDIGAPKAQVARWKLEPFATDYLSDDLYSKDWEDRWRASWRVEVQLGRPIDLQPGSMHGAQSLASDRTWQGDEPVPPVVMVVSDFEDPQTMQNVRRLLTSGKALPAVARLEIAESPARENQLLITLPAGKSFFEGGAQHAVKIEEVCRAHGGTTHWRDRARRR